MTARLPDSQTAPLPDDLPFQITSKTIGQGAYAFIRKATPRNKSQPVIAIKFINKEHARRFGGLKREQIQHEIKFHRLLGVHRNVIRYLSDGENGLYTWIAMELADGGDLFDKIEADEGVPEDVAHFYFTQLINAVSYIHSKGVAHRDIKPENMLLSADGDLKLSDFGLAALFRHGGKSRVSRSVCGSPPYVAPEILAKCEAGYELNLVDIWSSGVVLFVLLVGNTPWDEPTKASYEFCEYVQTDGNTTDELGARLPNEAASLLRGMLKVDPRERFGLEDIRMHPWYTRRNTLLGEALGAANSVSLAHMMLRSLRIDLTADPTASPRKKLQQQLVGFAATQPEQPVVDMSLEWEQPARFVVGNKASASQPVRLWRPGASQASGHLIDRLGNDPSLSQFTRSSFVSDSLTQGAQRFRDILPRESLARFFSSVALLLLVPSLAEALHRLGVPCRSVRDDVLSNPNTKYASIRVKTVDGRQQSLNGSIVVSCIDDGINEVRFIKIKGDPLEWRRFFKKMVVLCKDKIIIPS